ncbi:unnamed protein product, partial [Brassica oleracea var. botrytis]
MTLRLRTLTSVVEPLIIVEKVKVMDLRDVVRSWRLMARNCSGTSEIGTVQFPEETCLGAFLTAQESQLITAFLFCLRHTLIFSDVHETIHEGINLGEDINVSIVRDTSCAKSSFLRY